MLLYYFYPANTSPKGYTDRILQIQQYFLPNDFRYLPFTAILRSEFVAESPEPSDIKHLG